MNGKGHVSTAASRRAAAAARASAHAERQAELARLTFEEWLFECGWRNVPAGEVREELREDWAALVARHTST